MLTWLVPVTNHFPRAHRHTVTQRLLEAAFDLRERLEEANIRRNLARLERLERADEALIKLRLYVRLVMRWDWLTKGQYQHAAAMLVEIGKLLGGWKKVTASRRDAPRRVSAKHAGAGSNVARWVLLQQ